MEPTPRAWLDIAPEYLGAAQLMLDGGRYLYAAFEAHQSVEKSLNRRLVTCALHREAPRRFSSSWRASMRW